MSDMLRGQVQMMDYDAICTFVFKDYKDFAKFMSGLSVFFWLCFQLTFRFQV